MDKSKSKNELQYVRNLSKITGFQWNISDLLISKESFMQTKHLCAFVRIVAGVVLEPWD